MKSQVEYSREGPNHKPQVFKLNTNGKSSKTLWGRLGKINQAVAYRKNSLQGREKLWEGTKSEIIGRIKLQAVFQEKMLIIKSWILVMFQI